MAQDGDVVHEITSGNNDLREHAQKLLSIVHKLIVVADLVKAVRGPHDDRCKETAKSQCMLVSLKHIHSHSSVAHKVLWAGQQVVCEGDDFFFLNGIVSGNHVTVEVLVEGFSVAAPVRSVGHKPKAEGIGQPRDCSVDGNSCKVIRIAHISNMGIEGRSE